MGGRIDNRYYTKRIITIIRIICTFFLMVFALIFFASDSLLSAFNIINNIFVRSTLSLGWVYESGISVIEVNIMLISIFMLFVMDIFIEKKRFSMEQWYQNNVAVRLSVLYVLIFAVLIIGIAGKEYNASDFIYFNF